MITLNNIILLIVIILIIICLFSNTSVNLFNPSNQINQMDSINRTNQKKSINTISQTNQLDLDNEVNQLDLNYNTNAKFLKKDTELIDQINLIHKERKFIQGKHILNDKIKNDCCVEKNIKTDFYIDKFHENNCLTQPQSTKQFNNNFFKFRDYTNDNSSITLDSVDKMTNLILNGDLGQTRYPNTKISDIFDNLTKGPELNSYQKPFIKIPKFDNTMHDGYNYKFVTGMLNTRDNWKYKNERVMNGGSFMNNIYPDDKNETKYYPIMN